MDLANLENYVSNALEVVQFKLVREREDIDDETNLFYPEMAHQIFGNNESIFGYKNLRIQLYYMAGSLDIYFGMKFDKKIDETEHEKLEPDNIVQKLSEIIPMEKTHKHLDTFNTQLNKSMKDFRPFGEKIDYLEVTVNGKQRTFEFYKCDVKTPNFLSYHAKLQTFLLWFVDAASYIDTDDDQWLFFVCYEKYQNNEGQTLYASVGYITIYLYYAYPENLRPRISQMLILPPFQKLGIGTKIIEVVYNYFKKDPKIVDITVEDPSDSFRRLRNFVCVKLCRKLPAFSSDKIKNGFTKEMIQEAQNNFKINASQSRTIYEILRLFYTNVNNDEEYRAYRLTVKKRLNQHYHKQRNNIEKLSKAGVNVLNMVATLPTVTDRIEQLKHEYLEIENEYNHILKRIDL